MLKEAVVGDVHMYLCHEVQEDQSHDDVHRVLPDLDGHGFDQTAVLQAPAAPAGDHVLALWKAGAQVKRGGEC